MHTHMHIYDSYRYMCAFVYLFVASTAAFVNLINSHGHAYYFGNSLTGENKIRNA